MPRCEGKRRRDGQPCEAMALAGRRFCRVHGGKQRRGPESPVYKHGRYSTAAPARMREDIDRLLQDGQLLDLNEELGLLKARALDVLTRVDAGESGRTWRALRTQVRDYRRAVSRGDAVAQADAVDEICRLVGAGNRDWDAWEDVRSTIRDVTRVAESQRRRALEQHHMIAVDAAYALLDSLVDAVRRAVPDEHARDAVNAEFLRLVHRPGVGAAYPEA